LNNDVPLKYGFKDHSRSLKMASFDRLCIRLLSLSVCHCKYRYILYHFRHILMLKNIVTMKSRLGSLTLRIYTRSVHRWILQTRIYTRCLKKGATFISAITLANV